MNANDMAHSNSQGCSADKWFGFFHLSWYRRPHIVVLVCRAVGSTQDDADELGYHMRNQAQSQETNIPSQLDLPNEQDSSISIHSLPSELLLEVICTAMCGEIDEEYYRSLFSLSGVCSRWYHLILDSPSLWIRLNASDSPEILKVALKRSSGRPLDIVLYADTLYNGQESLDHLDWFLATLGSHVDRWRSMDITYPPLWTDTINAALEDPALNLKKLSLWAEDKVHSAEEIDFFAGTAPRLNDLTLNGVSICWDSEVLRNLTALDLSYINFPSTDEILNALSYSPHLRTLIIDRCTTGRMTNASSPSIQLLHLSVLQVDLGSLEATEDFLSRIEDDRDDAPLLLLSRRKKPSGIPELESAEETDMQQPLT